MNIFEIGIEHGKEEGIKEGIKVLVETCAEFGLSKSDTCRRVEEKFLLSSSEAEEYLKKYWMQKDEQ